jgi:hypothetical protein
MAFMAELVVMIQVRGLKTKLEASLQMKNFSLDRVRKNGDVFVRLQDNLQKQKVQN